MPLRHLVFWAAILGACCWLVGWCVALFGAVVGPANFEVRAVTEPSRLSPLRRANQVWIHDLRIDGESPAEGRLRTRGDWRTERSEGTTTGLVQESGTGGSIAVRAMSLSFGVLHHPWSGGIEVLRDGEPILFRNLYAPDDSRWEQIAVDSAVLGSSTGWVVAALAAIAMLVLRPWCSVVRSGIALVSILLVVHLAYWSVTPVGLTNDSPFYGVSAYSTWAMGRPGPFPPGYGSFMMLTELLGFSPGLVITMVQHLLWIVSVLLVHLRLSAFAGNTTSLVACLVAGLLPQSLIGPQMVMSEIWTGFLMTAVLWILTAPSRASPARFALAGLATAWAALSRAVPLVSLAPLLALASLLPWRSHSWLRLCIGVGLAVGLPVATLVQSGLRSGRMELTDINGRHLYNHFVHAQKLLDPRGPATRQLQAYLGDLDPRDLPHWEVTAHVPEPLPDGRRNDDLIHAVAMEAAATASLFEHVAFTMALTWRNLSGDPRGEMPLDNQSKWDDQGLASTAVRPAPVLAERLRSLSSMGTAFPLVWFAICLMFAAGCLVTPALGAGAWHWLAWISLPWTYLFASSAVECELPRYHVAVAHIVVAFAVATPIVLLKRIRRRG